MKPIQSSVGNPLSGVVAPPGDKSISHRAFLIGALAVGTSKITGVLEAQDVLATINSIQALGARVKRSDGNIWHVSGRGLGALCEPKGVIDLENSGTAARLLLGILATHDIRAVLTGDKSLCNRPMKRVIAPLLMMGADIEYKENFRLPVITRGTPEPLPLKYELPIASAQVKSAIILAGLNAPGCSSVVEPYPTRDHTENLLRHFGANISVTELSGNRRCVTIQGQPELSANDISVPGDISSASFLLVAALIVPGSRVECKHVGINPLRTGLIKVLKRMGAAIEIRNKRSVAGEIIADIKAEASSLKGITVKCEEAPSMIDEYPILAIAAAFAEGKTRMEGLSELRVKESDRLAAMKNGLERCGVETETGKDWLVVHGVGGAGKRPKGGKIVPVEFDHRIAMSFLVMGMMTERPVTIDDGSFISTSFPQFCSMMLSLGANIVERSQS